MPWFNATASSLLTGLAKLPLLARNGVGFCLQPLNLRAFFQPEPCGEVLSMLSTPLKSISERFMSTFEDWVKPFKTWKSHEIPKSSQVSIIFPLLFSCHAPVSPSNFRVMIVCIQEVSHLDTFDSKDFMGCFLMSLYLV